MEQKLDNFKAFVKEVSHNESTVKEYENLSWFKMQALAYVLLIPQRENLDLVVAQMQKKLDFDDEHRSKFKRYLSFFIEYLTGNPLPPDENALEEEDLSNLSYEERLERIMKDA